MAGRWETHRGDEWWYNDYWCKFDAGFNSAYPGTLSIDRAEFRQGQLSESRVHSLLWSTQQQFKDNVIVICGLGELLPILDALQGNGLLKMVRRDSTHSKCIQVTHISAPPIHIKESAQAIKKAWWQLW